MFQITSIPRHRILILSPHYQKKWSMKNKKLIFLRAKGITKKNKIWVFGTAKVRELVWLKFLQHFPVYWDEFLRTFRKFWIFLWFCRKLENYIFQYLENTILMNTLCVLITFSLLYHFLMFSSVREHISCFREIQYRFGAHFSWNSADQRWIFQFGTAVSQGKSRMIISGKRWKT